MDVDSTELSKRATTLPTVKYVFLGLVVTLLVIAVSHLFLVSGLTTLYLGLPLWAWVQLVVVSFMLVLAWIAVQLLTRAREGGV